MLPWWLPGRKPPWIIVPRQQARIKKDLSEGVQRLSVDEWRVDPKYH